MNKPLFSAIALLVSLFSIASCNAENAPTGNVAAVNTTAAGVMQAGGYSNIDNSTLKKLLDDNVLIVDIRRQEEWQHTGIIKGSKTITFFDRTGQINNDFLPQFTAIAKPDQPVILICRTGNRTKAASEAIAKQLGYMHVMNVTTGIMGWIEEKRPVVKY